MRALGVFEPIYCYFVVETLFPALMEYPVGEELRERLGRGEPRENVFRLPTDVPQQPGEETEPILAVPPQPDPIPPIETAQPAHPHDHDKPRHRHFEDNILLVSPDEADGYGITVHTPTFRQHIRHTGQKCHDFAVSTYILAAGAFLLRFVVFFSFLFAGSATGAGLSLLLGLTEVSSALAVRLRRRRGFMRIIKALGNWCLLACAAELGLAISVCITNWVHIEQGWARWIAVAFSFMHAVLVYELGVSLINVLHCKMVSSFQTAKMTRASRLVHGDTPRPGYTESAKRTQ